MHFVRCSLIFRSHSTAQHSGRCFAGCSRTGTKAVRGLGHWQSSVMGGGPDLAACCFGGRFSSAGQCLVGKSTPGFAVLTHFVKPLRDKVLRRCRKAARKARGEQTHTQQHPKAWPFVPLCVDRSVSALCPAGRVRAGHHLTSWGKVWASQAIPCTAVLLLIGWDKPRCVCVRLFAALETHPWCFLLADGAPSLKSQEM